MITWLQPPHHQVAEYERRARRAGKVAPPLFLVFATGPMVPTGRVLPATGDVLNTSKGRLILLWLPLGESKHRPRDPDQIFDVGGVPYLKVGQTMDGCAPANDAAVEMCEALTKITGIWERRI